MLALLAAAVAEDAAAVAFVVAVVADVAADTASTNNSKFIYLKVTEISLILSTNHSDIKQQILYLPICVLSFFSFS